MEQNDLLRRLVGVLETMGAPYMVVGSFASMAYGEPRMTQDIDVVAELDEDQGRRLCKAFPPDLFYASESAALDAIRRRSQFNIIDSLSSSKIDVILVPPGEWGRSEISRRQKMKLLPDLEAYCARPEDVILGKLGYYAEGGSEKHLRDITGILKVSGSEVDREYVALWAQRLGLGDVWQAVVRKLGA